MEAAELRAEKKRNIALLAQIAEKSAAKRHSSTTQPARPLQSSPKPLRPNRKIIKEQEKADRPVQKTQLLTLSPAPGSFKGVTPILGLDCEMILGVDDQRHIARVSLVNYNRHVVLDAFVRPPVAVKNYLTEVTNITHHQLRGAKLLAELLPAIRDLLCARVVVGHSLDNDLQLLGLELDARNVRDVVAFRGYRNGKYRQSLKALALAFLGYNVQSGAHSSVEDARTALELYKLNARAIDGELRDDRMRRAREQAVPEGP